MCFRACRATCYLTGINYVQLLSAHALVFLRKALDAHIQQTYCDMARTWEMHMLLAALCPKTPTVGVCVCVRVCVCVCAGVCVCFL